MAQHKSAKKRARQDLKRRARNRHVMSGLKGAVKAVREATESGSADAGEKLRAAERAIRKATTKGVLSKPQASRRISRLAKSVQRANA